MAPRQVGEAADQVRRRRAHGEGADQDAQGEAAALAKPRRHDLHRRRVGARHGDAGDESQDQGRREAVDPERDGGIGGGAERAARHHQRPGRPHVGQVDERAGQRAEDESELDGDGQRGGARITEMPLARQRGQDGRRTEPERKRQQLRDGEGDQRAPPGRRKGLDATARTMPQPTAPGNDTRPGPKPHNDRLRHDDLKKLRKISDKRPKTRYHPAVEPGRDIVACASRCDRGSGSDVRRRGSHDSIPSRRDST